MHPSNPQALLNLLQLASPALPVGAYSYSEGLETLVEQGIVSDRPSLQHWLTAELTSGGIRMDAGVMVRAYRAMAEMDMAALERWNAWLSATKDAEEMRHQSWQMGQSLMQLLQAMGVVALENRGCDRWNFATAFGMGAAAWQIPLPDAALGYLHSWASNLVNAGVKLIPLGQTAGQQVLRDLQGAIARSATEVLCLEDDDLMGWTWGVALASANHETLYSRLFRS